ncbi:MAG TPA: c-type cytochrome [Bacteroidales bacterium]|jgi:mono/diheme cytochrome c family protein|nr:c-type cytochrome [Bacteroidales bacterium]
MKNAWIAVIFLLFSTVLTIKAQSGEELFKTNCSSCHTVGKGRLVGPDLSGVYNLRNDEWLHSFIRSSQKMIQSGDKDAVAIFNEYKIPMPDQPLNDQQISSILDYIKQTDNAASGAQTAQNQGQAPADSTGAKPDSTKAVAAVKDTATYSADDVNLGGNLFFGYEPFVNGAPPCMSCHDINNPSALGGGRLAIDLSASYPKLGPAGIQGIVANPPFPAMKAAIKGQVTPEEIRALTAFLKAGSERSNYKKPSESGIILFTIGLVLAIFIIVQTFILYDNRNIPDRNILKPR